MTSPRSTAAPRWAWDDRLRTPAQRLFGPQARRLWLAMLAVGAVLVLLFLFQRVLHQAMAQGQTRREAATAHAREVWQCNDLRPWSRRDACLVDLASSETSQWLAAH